MSSGNVGVLKTRVVKCAFQVATGAFEAHRTYSYFTDSEDVEIGDYAVVNVGSNLDGGLKVVKVVDVVERCSKTTKWVVGIVNVRKAEERRKRLIEIEDLKATIKQRADEVKEMESLEKLAEKDTTLKQLLENLKAKVGTVNG